MFLWDNKDTRECNELHTGNTPRSIMTKGSSTSKGTVYGNLIRGNKDKLMISYLRHDNYTMSGTCTALFAGDMHFFGGSNYSTNNVIESESGYEGVVTSNVIDFTRQHFMIKTHRTGRMDKIEKLDDLDIGFEGASCGSFQIASFLGSQNVVIICFDLTRTKSCYLFDGEVTYYISDSNYDHLWDGLVNYKDGLLTVGSWNSGQKTEILQRSKNGTFIWTVIEPDFNFTTGKRIVYHSLVTIEASDMNEEYVLLIGGVNDDYYGMKNVFKFNDTWHPFGQLKKPRSFHNSIYWNGGVYIIGGIYPPDENNLKHENEQGMRNWNTKMEIWTIKDSPDQFKTSENWPMLRRWLRPHLFIVPDSFFPDK